MADATELREITDWGPDISLEETLERAAASTRRPP
jgi:hypothetical protein